MAEEYDKAAIGHFKMKINHRKHVTKRRRLEHRTLEGQKRCKIALLNHCKWREKKQSRYE